MIKIDGEDVRTPSELWQLKEVRASVFTVVIGLAITLIGSLVLKSSRRLPSLCLLLAQSLFLRPVEQIAKWIPKNRQEK